MKKYEKVIIDRLIKKKYGKYPFDGYQEYTFNETTYNIFANSYYLMGSAIENYGYSKNSFCKHANIDKLMNGFSDCDDDRYKSYFVKVYLDKDDIEYKKRLNRKNHTLKKPCSITVNDTVIGFNLNYMSDFLKFFKTDYCFMRKRDFEMGAAPWQRLMFFENKEEKKIGLLTPVYIHNSSYYDNNDEIPYTLYIPKMKNN